MCPGNETKHWSRQTLHRTVQHLPGLYLYLLLPVVSGVTSVLRMAVILFCMSEWEAGGNLSVRETSSSIPFSVTLTLACCSETERGEGAGGREGMLWGDNEKPDKVWMWKMVKRARKVHKLRVIDGRCEGLSVIKTQWRWREGREKRGDGNWLSRFSTCTCHRANWSGEDKEERGVSHIRAFQEGSSCRALMSQAFLVLPFSYATVLWVREMKLCSCGRIQNWSWVQPVCFILTHQAFQVVSSFKYSVKKWTCSPTCFQMLIYINFGDIFKAENPVEDLMCLPDAVYHGEQL